MSKVSLSVELYGRGLNHLPGPLQPGAHLQQLPDISSHFLAGYHQQEHSQTMLSLPPPVPPPGQVREGPGRARAELGSDMAPSLSAVLHLQRVAQLAGLLRVPTDQLHREAGAHVGH